MPTTLLKPATDTIDADFTRANELYKPQGIEIERGVHIDLSEKATRQLLGGNTDLDEFTGDKATKEELKLIEINRSKGRIAGYWVPTMTSSRGEAVLKSDLKNRGEDRESVVVDTSKRAQDTFPHELGHALGLPHDPAADPNNLMAEGKIRNTTGAGIDKLTDAQVAILRASIFAEVGRRASVVASWRSTGRARPSVSRRRWRSSTRSPVSDLRGTLCDASGPTDQRPTLVKAPTTAARSSRSPGSPLPAGGTDGPPLGTGGSRPLWSAAGQRTDHRLCFAGDAGGAAGWCWPPAPTGRPPIPATATPIGCRSIRVGSTPSTTAASAVVLHGRGEITALPAVTAGGPSISARAQHLRRSPVEADLPWLDDPVIVLAGHGRTWPGRHRAGSGATTSDRGGTVVIGELAAALTSSSRWSSPVSSSWDLPAKVSSDSRTAGRSGAAVPSQSRWRRATTTTTCSCCGRTARSNSSRRAATCGAPSRSAPGCRSTRRYDFRAPTGPPPAPSSSEPTPTPAHSTGSTTSAHRVPPSSPPRPRRTVTCLEPGRALDTPRLRHRWPSRPARDLGGRPRVGDGRRQRQQLETSYQRMRRNNSPTAVFFPARSESPMPPDQARPDARGSGLDKPRRPAIGESPAVGHSSIGSAWFSTIERAKVLKGAFPTRADGDGDQRRRVPP